MPNLSSLANIPGYGAYIARREMNEGQELKDIQQAGALLQLKNAIAGQQEEQKLRSSLAQSGGDVEAAMQAALRAGRADVAAKLAPLVEARRKATPQPRVVAPGGALVDEAGKELYKAPFKPDAPKADPSEVQLVDFYNKLPETDPRKPLLKKFIDAKTRIPEKAEKTYPIVTTGDGIFERRPEGLVPLTDPKTKKPLKPMARERAITEYQGKNALYGTRALQSHNILNDLEEKINVAGLATKQAIQGMPVIGGPMGAAANVLLSKDQQSVEQAQRNFVNAVLRQESGAVISDAEFENARKQYFPAPGDSKQVIEQKRKNRMTAIAGFKKIAGPAWEDTSSPQDILNQADAILKGE